METDPPSLLGWIVGTQQWFEIATFVLYGNFILCLMVSNRIYLSMLVPGVEIFLTNLRSANFPCYIFPGWIFALFQAEFVLQPRQSSLIISTYFLYLPFPRHNGNNWGFIAFSFHVLEKEFHLSTKCAVNS